MRVATAYARTLGMIRGGIGVSLVEEFSTHSLASVGKLLRLGEEEELRSARREGARQNTR